MVIINFSFINGRIYQLQHQAPSIGKDNKVSYQACLPDFIFFAEKYGITSNKSKTLDVNIDDEDLDFKYYFLRGIIDGDGHIPKVYSKISIVSASFNFIKRLNKNFKGHFSKRKSGDYWDFFLDHDEDKNLPIENYMLDRKNQRLIKMVNHTGDINE